MRNENIDENTIANDIGFFLNCVTFDTVNVFDLQYSHIYSYLFEIIFTEL